MNDKSLINNLRSININSHEKKMSENAKKKNFKC